MVTEYTELSLPENRTTPAQHELNVHHGRCYVCMMTEGWWDESEAMPRDITFEEFKWQTGILEARCN